MEIGKRLRALREMLGISQQTLAVQLGSTQSSINRYENEQALPPSDLLLRYADYFDVSLDYLFGRTDMPQGKLYAFKPKHTPEKDEMRRFIEMCFEPGSPANAKLKEMLLSIVMDDTQPKDP